MKLEAEFFGLQGLTDEVEEAMKPDAEIVIDARGTRITTTRKIIAKGKGRSNFPKLFDLDSPKFLKADGSYKIDLDHRYVEFLVAECQSDGSSCMRVCYEFNDKYGKIKMSEWLQEFMSKYY